MQTMSFDGRESAQIRTANAGGVNIIFNGRALGPLGRRGQSRTFVFTKSGYEVVQGRNDAVMTRRILMANSRRLLFSGRPFPLLL